METAKPIIVGDKIHRPLYDETLSREDLRVARVELNETPERKEEALKTLKQLLKEQDDFIARTDDLYLMRFLRCRKFDCNKAFKTIRDHYKFRKQNPGIYPAPSKIEQALRLEMFSFLPHRDHKGRGIFIIRFGRWNPVTMPYNDFVAAGNCIAEYILDNAVTQINGYVGIWDFKGFGFSHFLTFCSPKHIILLTTLMQDRFPARFKMAYCVNCLPIVNTSWNLFKQVMKEKFRKRIQILSPGFSELHQNLDPSILPPEYGGTMMTPESSLGLAQGVLDKENYFVYNNKFGF